MKLEIMLSLFSRVSDQVNVRSASRQLVQRFFGSPPTGVKPFRAKCLQLITAVGALLGCFVSLLAEGSDEAVSGFSSWILPFTAGGFIYIATVSIIPELLQGSTLKQSVGEILALLTGLMMMVIIAQYE